MSKTQCKKPGRIGPLQARVSADPASQGAALNGLDFLNGLHRHLFGKPLFPSGFWISSRSLTASYLAFAALASMPCLGSTCELVSAHLQSAGSTFASGKEKPPIFLGPADHRGMVPAAADFPTAAGKVIGMKLDGMAGEAPTCGPGFTASMFESITMIHSTVEYGKLGAREIGEPVHA